MNRELDVNTGVSAEKIYNYININNYIKLDKYFRLDAIEPVKANPVDNYSFLLK